MAREFRLPDIGEGLAEAEVVSWLVSIGDEVHVDQNVVEVETDKAVVEIPIPYAGTVLHLGAAEGEVVEVGDVLIVVGEAGEVYPPQGDQAAPIVGSLSDVAEELPALAEASRSLGGEAPEIRALPVVRKLARDLGVDLAGVSGTGPDGRITREDVVSAAEATGAPTVVAGSRTSRDRPATPEPLPEREAEPGAELEAEAVDVPVDTVDEDEPVDTVDEVDVVEAEPAVVEDETVRPGSGSGERTRMSRLRRTIAANMSRSWSEIPHVTTFDEVDAGRLLDARRALETRHGVAVPLDSLAVKAVIPALRAFPEFNASLDGEDLILHEAIHMGVAVDTPDGLMVVVIRDDERLDLMALAGRLTTLAEGAKSRALAPEELTGQTFTVSNIGAVGGGLGTPIVPYGTAGILSVGRAVEKPVVRDGTIAIVPMMPLSLSYDHRIIDGGLGRRFMAMVLENLSEPTLFLA